MSDSEIRLRKRIYRRYIRAHHRHYRTTSGYCDNSSFWLRGWLRAVLKEMGGGVEPEPWLASDLPGGKSIELLTAPR